MKPILTILSLLLPLQCFAQYDTFGRFLIPQMPRTYTAVKLSPFSLAEFDNNNITVALEQRFDVKNAAQIQFGYTLPANYIVDGKNVTRNGFKLRMEYRRYFNQRTFNIDWFYSPEIFYTQNEIPVSKYFFSDTTSHTTYLDDFVLAKKMYGMAIRIGLQRRLFKHFLFEVYTGPGFKYKHVRSTGRTNESDPWDYPQDFSGRHFSDKTGEYTAFVLPTNFFIGYFFH